MSASAPIRIAIIGGGPSGLFVYKQIVDKGLTNCAVTIFESRDDLGSGMPYSIQGANHEHVTNVSGNEIPALVTGLAEWIDALPRSMAETYQLDKESFHDFKVVPRLLFGKYLATQFGLLRKKAAALNIETQVCLNTRIRDVVDNGPQQSIKVHTDAGKTIEFDFVIICTGHHWPVKNEGNVPGYFDSPYPPQKLAVAANHSIAIRGSSLTAIDAIRTLARNNGHFSRNLLGKLVYHPDAEVPDFNIVMHSLHGLLPAIRFHLDDPHLTDNSTLTEEEVDAHIDGNDGFMSLDYIFEQNFKEPLREKDPAFYSHIQDMNIEAFVETMMKPRLNAEPFAFFKKEYREAEKSIRSEEPIFWKELLAVLSFAMNYPAKHLSAEDMTRLHQVLMPLISIIIAFIPQQSCEELIALHDAGRLSLVTVDKDSEVIPQPDGGIVYEYTGESGEKVTVRYSMFVDCTGQRRLPLEAFPFKSLLNAGAITGAAVLFKSATKARELLEAGNDKIFTKDQETYYLEVDGAAITDNFEIVGKDGKANRRIYLMAVPYIGGFNPDYSGLDFSEAASTKVVANIIEAINHHQSLNQDEIIYTVAG